MNMCLFMIYGLQTKWAGGDLMLTWQEWTIGLPGRLWQPAFAILQNNLERFEWILIKFSGNGDNGPRKSKVWWCPGLTGTLTFYRRKHQSRWSHKGTYCVKSYCFSTVHNIYYIYFYSISIYSGPDDDTLNTIFHKISYRPISQNENMEVKCGHLAGTLYCFTSAVALITAAALAEGEVKAGFSRE